MAIGEEKIESDAHGVSVRTTSTERTGIQAYLTLPESGAVGSGDGSYFNFYIGFGEAGAEGGISYTRSKYTDGPWRKFLNCDAASKRFDSQPLGGSGWGTRHFLKLVVDASSVATFWIDDALVASYKTNGGKNMDLVKLSMAMLDPVRSVNYTKTFFGLVKFRLADRSTWVPWNGGYGYTPKYFGTRVKALSLVPLATETRVQLTGAASASARFTSGRSR